MTPKKARGDSVDDKYAYYIKFFRDPPNASRIWTQPYKKPAPGQLNHDPVEAKMKAGIVSERRYLGKGSHMNILRTLRVIAHRMPDFQNYTVGTQGGAFKIITTELSQTEPSLRGISQRAIVGMYHRVIDNYKGMNALVSQHPGDKYRIPNTVMWRAIGELARLDGIYRGGRSAGQEEYFEVEEDDMDEEDDDEFEEYCADDAVDGNYGSRSKRGMSVAVDQRQSRKRAADSTEPFGVAMDSKRAQRAASHPAQAFSRPQQRRHSRPPSRSPSVHSISSSHSNYSGPILQDERSQSLRRNRDNFDDTNNHTSRFTRAVDDGRAYTPLQEYAHARPVGLSHDKGSNFRNATPAHENYHDDLDGGARMEDMIRSLHRDTRIQMANMRSAIEIQQAQLDSLQDTLDTILRRISAGGSSTQQQQYQHQHQERTSTPSRNSADDWHYSYEDDRKHRRYSESNHSHGYSSNRRR
ncbi:hypothetical protein BGX29_003251 [Mortierella sp. GBA35]|nr:hypothetical protein BGX29_003251 [Mortierella sp. GBA35]